jgi:hypothetical protein
MLITEHFLCLTNSAVLDNGLQSAPVFTELFPEYALKNRKTYIYKLKKNARKVLFKNKCMISKKYTSEINMW